MANRDRWPQLYWIDVPTQHFQTPSGQFDWAGSDVKPAKCVPVNDTHAAYSRQRHADAILHLDVDGGAVHAIRTWEHTVGRHDLHQSPKDCTHYVNPSPVTVAWSQQTMWAILNTSQK